MATDDEAMGEAWKPSPALNDAVKRMSRELAMVERQQVLAGQFLRSVSPETIASINAVAKRTAEAAAAALSAPAQRAVFESLQRTVEQVTANVTKQFPAHVLAQLAEQVSAARLSTAQLQVMSDAMVQLRGVMDTAASTVKVADVASVPSPAAPETAVQPRDWGITQEQAQKILRWLVGGVGSVSTVDGLIRELVGEEPSPLQVLYWSAGLTAMVLVCILLVTKQGHEG